MPCSITSAPDMEAVNKPRVLLVEDELLIRLFLAEALSDAGFEVVEAATGDEAAHELEETTGFGLLLTDLQIPGTLDGFGVARKAREKNPDTGILYMTGRPDALNRLGRTGHREEVLLKPYGPSQVVEAARRLLPQN